MEDLDYKSIEPGDEITFIGFDGVEYEGIILEDGTFSILKDGTFSNWEDADDCTPIQSFFWEEEFFSKKRKLLKIVKGKSPVARLDDLIQELKNK